MQYVIKIDNNYYAGQNKKYADIYNISGGGALYAKQLDLAEANRLKNYFEQYGRDVEIEEYDAKKYLAECLNKIIKFDESCRNGNDCGYAIRNNAQNALEFLKQL